MRLSQDREKEEEEEDEDEGEEKEEEEEKERSSSQRTPSGCRGNQRGSGGWVAADASGAMAEGGEGGEDEIQFLRTVSLPGWVRWLAGGDEREAGRGGAALRRGTGAVPGAFSAPAGCRGGPATYPLIREGLREKGHPLPILPFSPTTTSTPHLPIPTVLSPANLLLGVKPLMPKLPAEVCSCLS